MWWVEGETQPRISLPVIPRLLLLQCLHCLVLRTSHCTCICGLIPNHSQGVASSPGPSPPEERPDTHCLRMREIFSFVFSVKSFVHFLVCMRKIILTKNTELSLRYTLATNLTYRTLLGYFSDVAVSFFPNVEK